MRARVLPFIGIGLLMAAVSAVCAEQAPDFSREILPLLSENCFFCHGPDPKHRDSGLRLDIESEAKKAGKSSTAIVPGNSAKSELIERVSATDDETIMPPPKSNKKLSKAQIALLTRWVDSGAAWGLHWSFAPLKAPPVPTFDASLHNSIDAFIGAKLRREGLAFAPEASRAALLRRVTLSLTGLPPTPARLDEFLADTSGDAYEKEVDRLLASTAFGERLAWDWMEAARYADSNGYQGDNERTMWPWRDWVVKAFNAGMPYDQFTLWQIAGDQLPNATLEQKLATGFLRNHPINGEGGRISEENRIDYVMDMSETTGTVWMALTFNCCRCHDHKFDPLTKRDYYSLFAFFNQTPVDGGGGDPQTKPVVAISTPEQDVRVAQAEARTVKLEAEIKLRVDEVARSQEEWEKGALSSSDQQAADPWTVLEIKDAKAEKQTLTILPDQSVLAGGPKTPNDSYTIFAPTPPKTITAIRLEALKHESLTQNSLSRADSGNFVLTDFTVELRNAGENEAHPQKIASGKATFEQGGFSIDKAFDADPKSGWAVYEGRVVDREHEAVFIFDKPLATRPDASLIISLRHNSVHAFHNLGRFRLSVTDSKEPRLRNGPVNLQSALKVPRERRSAEQSKVVVDAHEAGDAALKKLRADLKAAKDETENLRKAIPRVMVMEDMPKPRKSFMLEKGIYDKHGEEVSAATPASLPPLPPDAPHNRLGLARWLIAAENPLTPRVTVNRAWQMLFGIGLVKTSEDFGVKAEFPRQLELLDFLAADFRDSGWDMKRLIRLIVTSRTFRQSSRVTAELRERDSENRWLARGPRYRMPSWMLRDQSLAASGLLVNKVGGPPVKPYQPAGIWEEATFGNKRYQQDSGEALYRRSLYTFWRRIVGPAEFFDTQSRSVCTVKPTRTNTPLHALTTLNDTTFVEAARVLAQRAMIATPLAEERVKIIYKSVLAREPKPEEAALLLAGLARRVEQFKSDPAAAAKFLQVGESKRNETLNPAEHAAWTVLSLTVFNLDEALNIE